MAQDIAVRSALVDKKIDNSRISFDPTSGMVKVDNMDFMKPPKIISDTAFTDQNSFNSAYNKFLQTQKAVQQPTTTTGLPGATTAQQPNTAMSSTTTAQPNPYTGGVFQSAQQGMSDPERFALYASDPTALRNEYTRANQALGAYRGLGDTTRENAALQWVDRLMKVDPNLGKPVNAQDEKINQVVDALWNAINNPQPIDPYSTPAYAAARAQSAKAQQEQVRAAQEAFGAAGFGRSGALAEAVSNIAGDQQEYIMTQVIPQIIAQEEARQQRGLQNKLGLLDVEMAQQGVQDARQQRQEETAYRDSRDAVADQRYENEFAYQQERDQVLDKRWLTEFEEDRLRYGEEFAYQKLQDKIRNAQQDRQLKIAQQNADTNADQEERMSGSQSLDELYRQWEATGVAPAGIPGVAQGTPLYDQVAARQANQPVEYSYKDDPDYQEEVANFMLDPLGAAQALRTNAQAYIEKYGIDGYNALFSMIKK